MASRWSLTGLKTARFAILTSFGFFSTFSRNFRELSPAELAQESRRKATIDSHRYLKQISKLFLGVPYPQDSILHKVKPLHRGYDTYY